MSVFFPTPLVEALEKLRLQEERQREAKERLRRSGPVEAFQLDGLLFQHGVGGFFGELL